MELISIGILLSLAVINYLMGSMIGYELEKRYDMERGVGFFIVVISLMGLEFIIGGLIYDYIL